MTLEQLLLREFFVLGIDVWINAENKKVQLGERVITTSDLFKGLKTICRVGDVIQVGLLRYAISKADLIQEPLL